MTARRRAFTLMEMLIATVIVAMLAGTLYASLRIAFKARSTALATADGVRQRTLSVRLLKADLQAAMIPNGILAGGFIGQNGQGVGGSGSATLTFYANPPTIEPKNYVGEIVKIDYACDIAPDNGKLILYRRVTRNLLAPTTPAPEEEILCRGLSGFGLSYFDGTTWQDAWDSTAVGNVLPQAVEVRLEWDATVSPAEQASEIIPLPCGLGVTPTSTGGLP